MLEPETPRMCSYDMELTEAEGHAIEALRAYQEASTNPALLARLEAWKMMNQDVTRYVSGRYAYKNAVAMVGETKAPAYFAAVVTIAGLYPLFLPLDAPLDALQEETEGGRDNG